jgi:hypothetical protein
MSKLTIEIEEGPSNSVINLSVDGEKLGPISNLKLDASKLDVIIPAIEIGIGEGLSMEDMEKTPELRASIAQAVGMLRKFRCVEVRAPEGF